VWQQGLRLLRRKPTPRKFARYVLSIAEAAPPLAKRLKPLNERSLYQMRGFSWARDRERRAEALRQLCDAGRFRYGSAGRFLFREGD
jgi:hypothetical protein